MKYFVATNLLGQEYIRTESGQMFPLDSDNMDYRIYEAWLAEGNTPEPRQPET